MATGDVGSFRLSRPVLLREIRKAAGQAGRPWPIASVGLGPAAPGLASHQKAVPAISAWGRVFTRMLDAPPVGSWPAPPEGGGQALGVAYFLVPGIEMGGVIAPSGTEEAAALIYAPPPFLLHGPLPVLTGRAELLSRC